MFLARLPRRTLSAAVVAAAVVVHEGKDKLPIYPIPEAEIVLQETPSELEQQIGNVRRSVTATYLDAHAQVQEVVSRWIGIEQSVERRMKSLLAPEEQLTPALLYIGVAALTGSVLARGRSLPIRLILPPTLLIASSYHFLPKTSANVSDYLGSLEDHYFPTLAEKHAIANAHTAMTWERVKEAASNSKTSLESGVSTVVEQIQVTTGLKLREALSGARAQASEAVHAVQQRAQQAGHGAEQKVEQVAHAVEQKVQEAAAQAKHAKDQALTETKKEVADVPAEPDTPESVAVETKEVKEVKRLV